MYKAKRHIILFFIINSFAISYAAQTPFYTFLNGWRGAGVTETAEGICCVSNYGDTINNTTKFVVDKVTTSGSLVNYYFFGNDSAAVEDANALGYGAISFDNNNNWMLSNYNTYTVGKSYPNVYRFNDLFDSVDKALLIPLNGNLFYNAGLKNIEYVNDTTIILSGIIHVNNIGKKIRIMSIDTLGNINWQTDIYSDQTTVGNFMNSTQIALAEDGGYFVSCLDVPDLPDIGNNNIYYLLVKLDSNGVIQWKKRITDGIHTSNFGSVIQKDTNSYLVTWAESWLIEYPNWLIGSHKALDSASVCVGEIDLQGNFKWKKHLYKTAINCDTLKSSDAYYPYNFIKLSDGNYLICVDHFMNDATYIKLTPEGEVIWNRKVVLLQEQIPGGLLSYTNIKYTKEASDGGILGVGEYYSDPSPLFPNGMRTSLLIKLDKYGCMEPGCQLEGCTDPKALNYNAEAVYDCGCVYDPCPGANKVTIDVRQNAIMSNTNFYLKEVNTDEKLIEHIGYYPSFYDNFKESVCISDNCEKEYELKIDIGGYSPPNAVIPFQDSDPYSLGYYAYFKVLINDSVIKDLGQNLFVDRDTTIYFSFCTPDPTTQIIDFNIYPNPTKDKLTLEIPTEIDVEEPLTIKIVDLLGKEVLIRQINSNQTILSLYKISKGLYTAIVYKNNIPIFTQKIIKQ